MKLPDAKTFDLLESKSTEVTHLVKKLPRLENHNFYIHIPDLEDVKYTNKYIKTIVSMVRASDEYRKYISFLKTELEVNKCSFFSNIEFDKSKKVTLEMHHYPFTIFEICKIVYTDMVQNNKKIDPFVLCDEVMKLHFEGLVGLVPLSLTAHQLAHAGSLFIPLDVPLGNVKAFIQRYNKALDDTMKDNLRNLILLTQQLDEEYSTMSLEKQITLLDIEDIRPRIVVKSKTKSEEQLA